MGNPAVDGGYRKRGIRGTRTSSSGQLHHQKRHHGRQADDVRSEDAARELALHRRRVSPRPQPPSLTEDASDSEANPDQPPLLVGRLPWRFGFRAALRPS